MKKFLTVLCASMLCFCCLALAACGGGGASSSAASSASSNASSSAAPADPSEKFVGDWKIAAVEMNGVTMVGDFTTLLGEDSAGMSMSIKKDGTGSMTLGDDAVDITWTQKGDDAITVTPVKESDDITTVDVAFEDNALKMEMKDDSFTGTAIFTADGTYSSAKEISADGAKPITSEDALIGTWKLTGANLMGVSMYGDADDLAAAMGNISDTTLAFEKGGTAKAFGEDGAWKVGSDGATLTLSGIDIPVKALGDDIAIDASAMLGGTMQILMVFSK